ncbi:CPBP family intramembrane glutamic endopeptidase [Pseudoalteromonas tunicata]|uniref:CPBP family intramembrane glutamic endopeptidase n=1 Tax=Pseudoalteromonas tunicata TaxID=314281 RepID=UPI0027401FBF|nr:CPBP family intramembrane glutamic endopeptidase [Pseudoalteromonas tunicata]MDP4983447.1 CPBP family intramembrane metalloprotease [Pseudoalteromonas tunicata]
MFLIEQLTNLAVPYSVLLIAMAITVFKPKYWFFAMLTTLILGYLYQTIQLIGMVYLGVAFAVSFWQQKSSGVLQHVLRFIIIVFCIALAIHQIPGFNNLPVIDNSQKGPLSMPFTLYLNWDKPFILFLLLALFPTLFERLNPQLPAWLKQKTAQSLLFLFIPVAIFGLAMTANLITWELRLPNWWWLFALNNLILTCVVEEVFFRGFILKSLTEKAPAVLALLISSILFGAAHFAGGADYMLVATCAGALYGLVYLISGQLRYAIFAHFSINFIHLAFFTYPMLNHTL